jgi:hypothetical protein
MAMEALLDYLDTNDPPLPGLLIGDTTFVPVQTRASGVLAVAAAVSPGEIRADLQTSLVHLEDGGGLSLYAAAQDALASGVSGGAAPVNHTPSVALAPSAAQVRIAAPTGSLSVAGQPVAPGAGVGIANFSGALAVTATVPLTDRVTLGRRGRPLHARRGSARQHHCAGGCGGLCREPDRHLRRQLHPHRGRAGRLAGDARRCAGDGDAAARRGAGRLRGRRHGTAGQPPGADPDCGAPGHRDAPQRHAARAAPRPAHHRAHGGRSSTRTAWSTPGRRRFPAQPTSSRSPTPATRRAPTPSA